MYVASVATKATLTMNFLKVVYHFCEALKISQTTFTLFVISRNVALGATTDYWKVSCSFVVDEDYVLRCFTMCGLMWLHLFYITDDFSANVTQITAPLVYVLNVSSKRTLTPKGPRADFAWNAAIHFLRFEFGFCFGHFQMVFTNGD